METEKMFKMFLFLPLPELIKIPNLKQFIETGRSYERRSEKTFKDQKQQTKSILDACGDAVIVCNEDRAIEIFNPAAEKLTGFTAEEVLRQDVTDCIIPNGVVHNTGLIRELFSSDTDKKFNSEVTIQTKTKEQFTALMSVSHTSFYNRNCVTLFIRDISEMKQRQDALIHQQHRAEQLLLNILPKTVAEELNSQQSEGDGNKKNYLIAHHFDEVTILFADIVGFTSMSSSMKPEELVLMLNSVFTLWDHLCDSFGVEKIKTIGDCFMAVSGAPVPFPEHADVMMDFAISMLDSLEMFNSTVNNKLSIRIGMNTGSVVAGVIGWKKIAWDIWGDCVNVASRMEHTGFPGHIQISESTYEKLKGKYPFESRGKVNIAGKGEMPTWLLKPTPSDKPRVVHKGPTACKEGATSTEPSSISNNTPNATMPQSFSVLSMASTISRDVTVEELLGM
ncbi:PAS domain S-box protein [Pelomyxa schiedti]|nr:PAS domain S-box protein [Pelomyxa schiedti]